MQAECKYIIFTLDKFSNYFILIHSIYQVHDELKDKEFKLELSMVGKEVDGLHRIEPSIWYEMAIEAGNAAKKEDDSDNEV